MCNPGSVVSSGSECSCGGAPPYSAQHVHDHFVFSKRTASISDLSYAPASIADIVVGDPHGEATLSEDLIVNSMSAMLDSEVDRNAISAKTPSWEEAVSVFFSVSKPQIATRMYLRRLVKYARCSEAAFVVVLVYLERLEAADTKLRVTAYNMHRLLITALMLAAKMLDDQCYSNAHYAKVGGIASIKEMNRLEAQMLTLLNYNLNVTPENFYEFVSRLRKAVPPTSPTAVSMVTSSSSPHSSSSQLTTPSPASYVRTTRTYSNLHHQQYAPVAQYIGHRGYEPSPQYVHFHPAPQMVFVQPHSEYSYSRGRYCSAET